MKKSFLSLNFNNLINLQGKITPASVSWNFNELQFR